jgi:hypothetical protein
MNITGKFAVAVLGALGLAAMAGSAFAQPAVTAASGTVAISDAGAVGTAGSMGAAAARTVIAKE